MGVGIESRRCWLDCATLAIGEIGKERGKVNREFPQQ
jgi:hypothetical protein